MHKKGSSEILSIWLFLSWIIIAIVIVAAVALFYSRSVDVRQVESEVLLKKISECVFPQNKLVYLKPTETNNGQGTIKLEITDKREDVGGTAEEFELAESDLTGLESASLNAEVLNADLRSSNAGANLPDVFQACFLTESILNTNSYFLSILLYKPEDYISQKLLKIGVDGTAISPFYVIKTGNPDLEIQCELKGKNFANCERKMFLVKDKNGLEFIAEITAASNNNI